MGPVAAVRILHRRKLAAVPEEERHALEEQLAAEHEKIAGGLERARDLGVIDEVIDPAKTRRAIAQAIAEATPARGAHGNIRSVSGRRVTRRKRSSSGTPPSRTSVVPRGRSRPPAAPCARRDAVGNGSLASPDRVGSSPVTRGRRGRASCGVFRGALFAPRKTTARQRVKDAREQPSRVRPPTTAACSQRTGAPSPARRKGSSSSSQGLPSRRSTSCSKVALPASALAMAGGGGPRARDVAVRADHGGVRAE